MAAAQPIKAAAWEAAAGVGKTWKSTLIGRLLYDCQAVYGDQLDAVEREAKVLVKKQELEKD